MCGIHRRIRVSNYLHMLVYMLLFSEHNHGCFIKGKSSFTIFDRYVNSKYKLGNFRFGCIGYYIVTGDRIERKMSSTSKSS